MPYAKAPVRLYAISLGRQKSALKDAAPILHAKKNKNPKSRQILYHYLKNISIFGIEYPHNTIRPI
ncbi:hypothetical protein LPBF_02260 [Flavobacterium crassostreae]|uniref:Uncharacterized protein n=1 Tax=Flavobacterium crassostreae TaxID=1763534 RepID=A0A1B9E8Y0_9FLAO|nr:hypothetical protein LPBF_02260 [Flavobacterium crassostreae]